MYVLRPRIIGVSGKKRSGKDTLAATLVENFGFARYAFADPLKELALDVNPLVYRGVVRPSGYDEIQTAQADRLAPVIERIGWERAKERPEVRRILQALGVGVRELDEDFWVRTTMTRALAEDQPVVITDVRFPNEVEAIRDAGGHIVRVTRPGMTHDDTHISETALDDLEPDTLIENDGTLEDLERKAEALFYSL